MIKFNLNPKVIKSSIIAAVVIGIITGLQKCTHINEDFIWDLFDEYQRVFRYQGLEVPKELNDKIIKNPKLLERRIKRDIDREITRYEEYENSTYIPNMKNQEIIEEVEKKKYTEPQRQIVKDAVYYECPNGSMGIHAVWYESKECNY